METVTLMLRLYELLAECSEEDFARAATATGFETTMGRVLRLLAEYRRAHGTAGNKRSDSSENSFPPITKAPQELLRTSGRKNAHTKSGLPSEIDRRLRDVIMSKRYFAKNAVLLEHIENAGLSVKLNAKEGRARVYAKVAAQLAKLSEVPRTLAARHLLSVVKDSETSRWFDVIRTEE
jgi:hypothetical protein